MPPAPLSLVLASPRTETLLTEKTRELQARIDTLERRVRDQAAELASKSGRSLAFSGGSFSDHWTQCWGHAGQAFGAMCRSSKADGVEPLLNETTTSSSSTNSPSRRPRSPSGSRGMTRSPSGMHAKHRRGMNTGFFAGIPDWSSAADKQADKNLQAGVQLGANLLPPVTNTGGSPLEDHEYLLDDEWGVEPSNGVINPKASWKEMWDLGVLFFILYSALIVPFRICFHAEAVGNLLAFEIFISIFFIVDVCFNFNTAYAVEDKWVIAHSRIVERYLKSWFWIDAPSSLPVELMTLFAHGDTNSHLSLLRFLRMFRLLRLLRLLKVDIYIARIEEMLEINLVALRILGMVMRLLFIVHLLGCFWFYVAWCAVEAGENASWILAYEEGAAYDTSEVSTQYLYSVYWALTTLTTVGYGDITPGNDLERAYCLFAMLVGAMMFGYMMSTIGSMVAAMDREAAIKEDRMDAVKEWMASRNIPQKLFQRVRKYYEHYYTKKSAFDEAEILHALTPGLRNECTAVLLRDTMGVFPLFALMGLDFQRAVYPLLKPVVYAHQDIIYGRGDNAEDTYFLRKGTVDVLSGGAGTEVLYRINQGQYFGEEVLTNQKRSSQVMSNGMSEMWTLSKEELEGVIRRFPHLRAKLQEFVHIELERKRRLNALSYRALIGVAESVERKAALVMQKAWVSYANKKAKETSLFADWGSRPLQGAAAAAVAMAGNNNPLLNAALDEIQMQLKTMKATMSSQGKLLEEATGHSHTSSKKLLVDGGRRNSPGEGPSPPASSGRSGILGKVKGPTREAAPGGSSPAFTA